VECESERVLLVVTEVEVEVESIEPGLERNTCSSGIRDKDMNKNQVRNEKKERIQS
jgi:hypothetical protein